MDDATGFHSYRYERTDPQLSSNRAVRRAGDRHERGLPEVPNGLALCKIHRSAYDVNILGISPDYRVHIRADILDEHDGPMLRWGPQEMNGARIVVPTSDAQQPIKDFSRSGLRDSGLHTGT